MSNLYKFPKDRITKPIWLMKLKNTEFKPLLCKGFVNISKVGLLVGIIYVVYVLCK